MNLYVVIRRPSDKAAKLPVAIQKAFPDANLKISSSAWLVAGEGTATEISNRLGVSDGKNGAAIVMSIGGYWGRASKDVWEWMKAKSEAKANGK